MKTHVWLIASILFASSAFAAQHTVVCQGTPPARCAAPTGCVYDDTDFNGWRWMPTHDTPHDRAQFGDQLHGGLTVRVEWSKCTYDGGSLGVGGPP